MQTFFFAPIRSFVEPLPLYCLRLSLLDALPDTATFNWSATTEEELLQFARDFDLRDVELKDVGEHTTLRVPGKSDPGGLFIPFRGRLLRLADGLFQWAHPGQCNHGRLAAEFLIAVHDHRLVVTAKLDTTLNGVSLGFSVELPAHGILQDSFTDAFPGLRTTDAEFAYLREPETTREVRRSGWGVLGDRVRALWRSAPRAV
jgi:hypothetical protein